MSDEHVKLVARIQHFYDVMIRRLQEMQDGILTSIHDIETATYRDKSLELNSLIIEYGKTFETFLYKETNNQ